MRLRRNRDTHKHSHGAPAEIPTRRFALVVNGRVADIATVSDDFAAVLKSGPVFVEIPDAAETRLGWVYDDQTGVFAPDDSD